MEEEILGKDSYIVIFIASHGDPNKSYYSESSNDEPLEEVYKKLYLKFMELREVNQKTVLDLNLLKTKKSTLLEKIKGLEEELLKVQLQLEKITDNRLAQMLIGQKRSHDKTSLGFSAFMSDLTNTPSSKIVFVKSQDPEPQETCEDKGKAVIVSRVDANVKTVEPKFKHSKTRRIQLTCHHCGDMGHIRPHCPQICN